jgi:hypothetical protein
MFNHSKYTKWYFSIVNRGRLSARKKGDHIYYEKHHIIPKSMQGSNKSENLVLLTAKEHYICHLLLIKMVITKKDRFRMTRAYIQISKYGEYSSRLYELHKRAYHANISGPNSPLWNKPKSLETIRKMKESLKALDRSGVNNNMYGKTHSIEARQKISKTHKGRIFSPARLDYLRQHSYFAIDNPATKMKGSFWAFDPVTSVSKQVFTLPNGWSIGRKL